MNCATTTGVEETVETLYDVTTLAAGRSRVAGAIILTRSVALWPQITMRLIYGAPPDGKLTQTKTPCRWQKDKFSHTTSAAFSLNLKCNFDEKISDSGSVQRAKHGEALGMSDTNSTSWALMISHRTIIRM